MRAIDFSEGGEGENLFVAAEWVADHEWGGSGEVDTGEIAVGLEEGNGSDGQDKSLLGGAQADAVVAGKGDDFRASFFD